MPCDRLGVTPVRHDPPRELRRELKRGEETIEVLLERRRLPLEEGALLQPRRLLVRVRGRLQVRHLVSVELHGLLRGARSRFVPPRRCARERCALRRLSLRLGLHLQRSMHVTSPYTALVRHVYAVNERAVTHR